MWILLCLMESLNSLCLFSLYSICLSLTFSVWLLSITLSSRLLIPFLLLITYYLFHLLFFKFLYWVFHFWYVSFYLFVKDLTNVLHLFLKSSIFVIITLNSLSSPLLISISLRSLAKILSYSFIWDVFFCLLIFLPHCLSLCVRKVSYIGCSWK